MNTLIIEIDPIIFTTGPFLKPIRVVLNGKEVWMWVVSEFIDDSYKDGDIFNPPEFVESKENLLNPSSYR